METRHIQENRMMDSSILLPELKVIAPQLPDAMLLHYIRQSAIEFAKRSQCVTRDICFDVQCGVDEYPIFLDDNEVFVSFQDHTVQSECCGSKSCKETKCNGYTVSWSAPRQRLVLSPKPSTSSQICLCVAVAPSLTACEFDERLISENYDGILHGAKLRIHALPRSKESDNAFDKNMIPYHERKYNAAISNAGIDRLTNNTRGRFKMCKPRVI